MGLECKTVNLRVYNKNIWDFCQCKRFIVSVIVLTHQRKVNLGECLWSIVNQKTDFDFEIVIVDDASSDGTEEVIERECKEFIQDKRVKHIKICTRLGYTKPCYIGAAASDGEFIVIQGADVIPITPTGELQNQCLQKLVEAFDSKTIATFARECRIFKKDPKNMFAKDPKSWRENPEVLRGMCDGHYGCKAYAHEKGGRGWFMLGAIRWADYKRLTVFRSAYPDTKLATALKNDGGDLKFIHDIIAVHLPHDREDLGDGTNPRWWTTSGTPF